MYFEVQVTLNCVFKNKELIQDFQQSTQPKIKLTQIFTAAIQTLTFKLRLANMIHSTQVHPGMLSLVSAGPFFELVPLLED